MFPFNILQLKDLFKNKDTIYCNTPTKQERNPKHVLYFVLWWKKLRITKINLKLLWLVPCKCRPSCIKVVSTRWKVNWRSFRSYKLVMIEEVRDCCNQTDFCWYQSVVNFVLQAHCCMVSARRWCIKQNRMKALPRPSDVFNCNRIPKLNAWCFTRLFDWSCNM